MNAMAYRIVAVFVLLAPTVAAQTNASNWNAVQALRAGTDVRVTRGAYTVLGKIDLITDGTLALTSSKGQEMFTQQEVVRVSVRKVGHRRRNALIGLGIGAGVGLGVGAAADASCKSFCFGGNFGKEIFAPLGAIAGVFIGALLPSGGWREIYRK